MVQDSLIVTRGMEPLSRRNCTAMINRWQTRRLFSHQLHKRFCNPEVNIPKPVAAWCLTWYRWKKDQLTTSSQTTTNGRCIRWDRLFSTLVFRLFFLHFSFSVIFQLRLTRDYLSTVPLRDWNLCCLFWLHITLVFRLFFNCDWLEIISRQCPSAIETLSTPLLF